MVNSRFYSSTAAVTNLQTTAGSGDATIQVASSSGFPNSFPYTLSLDYGSANEELVDVTGGGPSVFNVTRAVDGTSASSHNAGAVVRHVTSARDFTDSRTHEASSSGVHGITGAFVDTLSTQTLQNKTLSAPVINNGTVTGSVTATGATVTNGTFSGSTLSAGKISGATTMLSSPALSGTWSNSGDITNTGQLLQQNLVRGQRANATDSQYESRVAGDANARWFTRADGSQFWGPGTTAVDTSLSRTGVNQLQLNGGLSITDGLTTTNNATVKDITLTGQVQSTWTPVWTGLGSATVGTNFGEYYKLGKWVFWHLYTVFTANGSGTTQVNVTLPSIPFRDGAGANTTRQSAGDGWVAPLNIFSPGDIRAQVTAGGTTAAAVLNFYDNSPLQGQYIANGSLLTLNGMYREA
jgi:hypothetical protein